MVASETRDRHGELPHVHGDAVAVIRAEPEGVFLRELRIGVLVPVPDMLGEPASDVEHHRRRIGVTQQHGVVEPASTELFGQLRRIVEPTPATVAMAPVAPSPSPSRIRTATSRSRTVGGRLWVRWVANS